MTIVYDPTRAAELAANGTSNNPMMMWSNLATINNISAVNGSPATNAVTGTTYDPVIFADTSASASLVVSGDGPYTASCAAIYAHNLADVGVSARIEYQNGTSGWIDSGAGSVTPDDNQAIVWRFDETTADEWRILIFGITVGPNPVIGGFIIGVETIIEQRIYQGYTPPITPTEVQLIDNVSEGANLLGTRFIPRGSIAETELTHIKPETLRGDDWKGFQSHFNEGGGFIWAWRPTKYSDAFWAWRNGGAIVPTNSGPKDFMSFGMSMRLYDD